MPPPPRTEGGQRIYDHYHFDRLGFIRRCRELGFPLESVRSLLGLNDEPPSCGEVQSITLAHLDSVRRKIGDLKRLEKVLKSISEDCEGGDSPNCAIIDALRSDRIKMKREK